MYHEVIISWGKTLNVIKKWVLNLIINVVVRKEVSYRHKYGVLIREEEENGKKGRVEEGRKDARGSSVRRKQIGKKDGEGKGLFGEKIGNEEKGE